ncbi:TetR family transcriptional regulator [Paractinoplanes abujensis]|uniref:AcrR family transcriptional regulator n=1 Tax=Paractinoplanes abujensis TaxID=882441 RepID=A0A7W7CUF6_9ACTN|nr:TetR/AcrR family transcriptional regulator [Actinoplanes abujensis]MBB4693186.1 AcrR family transcriptional regulator [Actinoplanes abujensis]GID24386.1 TetR family transcriptional regulator [Actinoplanes abujensis]
MGVRDDLLAAARAELDEHGHAGISLRAVARRAGVSHAAPKHHFPDRAALLTAIATDGFTALAASLNRLPDPTLAALGQGYLAFGLANPALYDLMFRPTELHADDPHLLAAQDASLHRLRAVADDQSLTLISWALVHGLVLLTRDGALGGPAGTASRPELAHGLLETYAERITS